MRVCEYLSNVHRLISLVHALVDLVLQYATPSQRHTAAVSCVWRSSRLSVGAQRSVLLCCTAPSFFLGFSNLYTGVICPGRGDVQNFLCKKKLPRALLISGKIRIPAWYCIRYICQYRRWQSYIMLVLQVCRSVPQISQSQPQMELLERGGIPH